MDKKNLPTLLGFLSVTALIISGLAGYLVPHIALIWQISLGVSVLTLVGYIVTDREFYKQAFAKKTTRYGLNSILMSVIFVLIVAFINVIANEYDLKKDVSKNKLNTLSQESVKVLQGLDTDITMKAFLQPQQVPVFEKIFDRYAYHTDRLKKEYVDLDKDPLAVRRHNIKNAGTIVFESEARTARVENLRGADDPKLEEKLTNAIIQVAKGEKKKVYFLKGHGERSISDTGRDGYSQIKETLQAGRYNVEELMLLDKDAIPTDSDLLIVAGPKSDLTRHELKLLEKYLNDGGKSLIMVDPTSTPTIKPLLTKLGAKWAPKATIFETNKLQQLAGGNPLAPIVTTYDSRHEITKENKELSIFPIATPMERATKPPSDLNITALLKTSDRSLVANLKGNKLNVDQNKARKGPISIALAVSGQIDSKAKKPKKKNELIDAKQAAAEKKKELRAVVVGDSDFAANGVSRFGINSDLFQNMLSWLAKEEDLISIRPKDTSVSEFEITEARVKVIYLASVFILPIFMLISGISIWLSRRRK